MKLTVDILEEFFNGLSLSGEVLSATNDGTDTTLTVSKTYHARKGMSVSVDGTDFKILSVVNNQSITVSGVIVDPVAYTVPNPFYFHGTPVMTNSHISRARDDQRNPMIYLYEILRETDQNEDSRTKRTSPVRLFFLDNANFEDWETDDHYSNRLVGLNNLVDFIEESFKADTKRFYQYETSFDRTNHVNFGQWVDNKGHDRRIFDDNQTGVELSFNLNIRRCKNQVAFSPFVFNLESIEYTNNGQENIQGSMLQMNPVLNTGGGGDLKYYLEGELPEGVTFNFLNGVFSFDPEAPPAEYTGIVTAVGVGATTGFASVEVSFTIYQNWTSPGERPDTILFLEADNIPRDQRLTPDDQYNNEAAAIPGNPKGGQGGTGSGIEFISTNNDQILGEDSLTYNPVASLSFPFSVISRFNVPPGDIGGTVWSLNQNQGAYYVFRIISSELVINRRFGYNDVYFTGLFVEGDNQVTIVFYSETEYSIYFNNQKLDVVAGFIGLPNWARYILNNTRLSSPSYANTTQNLFAIYNEEITEAEHLDLYNNPQKIRVDGKTPVVELPLDDGVVYPGGGVFNTVGQNAIFQSIGDVNYNPWLNNLTGGRQLATHSYSVYDTFDGTGSVLLTSPVTVSDGDFFSINYIVKPEDINPGNVFLLRGGGFELKIVGGFLRFGNLGGASGGSNKFTSYGNALQAGHRIDITFTRNGNDISGVDSVSGEAFTIDFGGSLDFSITELSRAANGAYGTLIKVNINNDHEYFGTDWLDRLGNNNGTKVGTFGAWRLPALTPDDEVDYFGNTVNGPWKPGFFNFFKGNVFEHSGISFNWTVPNEGFLILPVRIDADVGAGNFEFGLNPSAYIRSIPNSFQTINFFQKFANPSISIPAGSWAYILLKWDSENMTSAPGSDISIFTFDMTTPKDSAITGVNNSKIGNSANAQVSSGLLQMSCYISKGPVFDFELNQFKQYFDNLLNTLP